MSGRRAAACAASALLGAALYATSLATSDAGMYALAVMLVLLALAGASI